MSALAGMRTSWVPIPATSLRRGTHTEPFAVHAASWEAAADAPADAPLQVCLHGLGGSHLNWSLLAPLLTDLGPVHAPDLAGFGRTPVTGRSASVGDNVDLVAGYLETVSPGRPVVLLGNSMGGHIAYSLAARRQDLVAALVLVGAAVPPLISWPDREVATRFALFAAPLLGRLYLEGRARRTTPAEQVRESLELCGIDVDAVDRDMLEAQVALAAERRRMPHATQAFLDASRSLLRRLGAGRGRLWAGVEEVTAPALILQGGQDRLVERVAADRLSDRRPDWEYRVYDELGHVVMVEAPDLVAADIRRWREAHLPVPRSG
jgi:pimeloyl-ACP methyl ester carboxylesterase